MRKLMIVMAALVVVAVAGTVYARVASNGAAADDRTGDTSNAASDSTATSSGSASSAGQDADVEAVDVAGARQAAIDAVALTDEVVRAGFISRRELIESFTTARFASTLADDTSGRLNDLMLELGARDADPNAMRLLEQPLTATAAAAAAGEVQVVVWSVMVIAAPGTGPGRQAWRTVTLDMVLVDGMWRVDGWASRPGPTPAPAAEAAFDDAESLVVPLGWDPAIVDREAP